MYYYETAESVTEGHPDKMCDIIADSILDECLRQDKSSRVAVEVMACNYSLVLAGEITTKAKVNYTKIARQAIAEIGYDGDVYSVTCLIHEQSSDINQAVNGKEDQGAGDQGIVYGYATNETDEMLPLAFVMAKRITSLMTEACKTEKIKGLLPDGKSQVTIGYNEYGQPFINCIVVSQQHKEDKDIEELRREVIEIVLKDELISQYGFMPSIKILVNPSGRFVIGGTQGDTGLTGRKLMVDTYGGLAKHGGGAFSGKDPSKVDRSAALYARHVAKKIVETGQYDNCEVSIAYAIGVPEPVMVNIVGQNAETGQDDLIDYKDLGLEFNFTPAGMIEELGLLNKCYSETARGKLV